MLVLSGSIDIVLPGLLGETLIVVDRAGSFSGEMSSIRSAGSIVRATDIDDAQLRQIIQADSELSEIFMRAFILRPVGLISAHANDVVLSGSENSVGTLRLQPFLTRNTYPYVNRLNCRA